MWPSEAICNCVTHCLYHLVWKRMKRRRSNRRCDCWVHKIIKVQTGCMATYCKKSLMEINCPCFRGPVLMLPTLLEHCSVHNVCQYPLITCVTAVVFVDACSDQGILFLMDVLRQRLQPDTSGPRGTAWRSSRQNNGHQSQRTRCDDCVFHWCSVQTGLLWMFVFASSVFCLYCVSILCECGCIYVCLHALSVGVLFLFFFESLNVLNLYIYITL